MDAKTLCLAALSKSPASGYEIRKDFEEGPFSYFQDAGFGSIYPALKKLVEDGLAELAESAKDDRADKKRYRITSAGRQALFDQVSKPPGEDKYRSDFLFVLMFAELLEPRQLDQILDKRIQFHKAVVAELEGYGPCSGASPGANFVREYGVACHRMAAEFLESRRHELIGNMLRQELSPTAAE